MDSDYEKEFVPLDPVNLISTEDAYVKKFRLYGSKTIFKFNNPPEGVAELDWLRQGFAKIVIDMKGKAHDGNQLGFTLESLNLKSKDPGFVAFRPASEIDEDVLWQIFGGIVQSNGESMKSTDTLEVQCTRVNLPVGTGGGKRPGFYNNFDEECKARQGIIVIQKYRQSMFAQGFGCGYR